jgi:hypothetical protein
VRAILSWNNPPPSNTPDHAPVWGNAKEVTVQVPLFKLIPLPDFFKLAQIELPPEMLEVIDFKQAVATVKAKALRPAELTKLYRDKGVPEHRFLFSELQQLSAKPALTEDLMAPNFPGVLAELDVNLSDVVKALLDTDGDTRYEELTCVGLDPNQDTLVGAFTVKLPCGYSGDPCTAGSTEYVAFWVDWGDGAGWTYAGTATANVHDFTSIPAEGLHYAVFVPVDLTTRRKPCNLGAVTAKVRAILSWQAQPPAGNPNWVPVWGNREETLVHIKPGPTASKEDHTPYIESVGNMAVCDIDQSTGLATGSGVLANFTANQAPFGGVITITGLILNPPNVLGGGAAFKYRIYVREAGGAWQALSNQFNITITQQNGVGPPTQFSHTQSVDADGYYTYQEQMFPNQWRLVAARVLARWITYKPMTGEWEIKLEAKLPDNTVIPAGVLNCTDGTTRSSVIVRLDEQAPTASIAITGFSRGGGPVQPAAKCGKFLVDDVLHGTYSTSDEHFRILYLWVEPSGPAHGASPNPSQRKFPVVPTTGESGTWTLDTSGMDPCGYIVKLWVEDRTIINSGSIGWEASDSAGFCLE